MKNSFFCFLICVCSFGSIAQSVRLSGKITNENSSPVQGASIILLNTNVAAITDATGAFIINALPGNYLLQVSAIGFAAITRELQVNKESSDITILLQPVSTRLDEVIVSAQKREELLQRLPLSVTAISSRQVRELRLWNIRDLTAIAPTFYSADPGDKRNVSSVRGITTTSYDPAIATYVDGVNQFTLDTYIPQLFDVERVEILRGPQGTLYGRNAMGGVINIITKKPTNATTGFAEINVGNFNLQRYTAGIRTPIIKDKLFFGAAGMYEGFNGYYTNDFNNTDFDKQSSVAGNYYLKFLPSANWTFSLNAKHVMNRNNGPFSLVFGKEEAFGNAYHLNQNAITKLVDNVLNTSLSINHTGQMVNFSSQTAYQSNYRYYKAPIDGDFSPIDGVTVINNYGKDWNNVKAWTQEFKFSSPASTTSPIQWTAGTYLFYQNSPNKQATRFGEDAALVNPNIMGKNFSLINTTEGKSKGVAFYGQATYSINNKLDVTGGLRYDHEQKEQSILGEYQQDPDPNPQFAYQADTSAKANFNAFSPKLSIAYHATKNNTLYAVYSRGYRAGGLTPLSSDPMSNPPLFSFEPEYSNNYEIGFKSLLLDNRLRINIAAFYSTINNAQVPTLVLPDAVTITKNAGELNSKGFELELAANPVKGLEFSYGFGYTNAEYKSLKLSQSGTEANLKGKKQIFTPDVTSMLTAQYGYSLGGKQNLQLMFRGEWKYLGTQFFDLANKIRQSSYNLLNTRIGVAGKNFELMFWGRNLGDKKYISYAYDFGAIHLGEPKTYGGTLMFSF